MNKLKTSIKKEDLIVIAIIFCFTIIAALVYLLTPKEFQNKKFEFNSIENKVNYINPRIKLEFNYPVDTKNLKESISIKNTEFEEELNNDEIFIFNNGQEVQLTFEYPLLSNSEYEITVSNSLQSIYGENLNKDINYKFETSNPVFSYLKKENGNDKIIKKNIDGAEEILVEATNIAQYATNQEYAVAASEKGQNVELIIKNIQKDSEKIIKFENKRIKDIAISPVDNSFLYTIYNIEVQEEFTVPTSNTELFFYTIQGHKQEKIQFTEDIAEIGEFFFSPDGSSLLFKNIFGANYFLVPIGDWNNLINLGTNLQTGGFDKDSEKILFTAFDPLEQSSIPFFSIFTSNRDNTKIKLDEFSIDARFFNKEDSIIFSKRYQNLESTRGLFEIIKLDLGNNNSEKILKKDDLSLELPKISPDDRYVLVEKYSEEQLKDFSSFRNYEFQNKPGSGELVVYDLITQEIVIDNLEGIEAEWIK